MIVSKALVFILLLANVVYFLWTQGVGGMHPAPHGPTVPSLRLLSESSPPLPAGTPRELLPENRVGAGQAPAGAAAGGPAPALDPAARCITVGPFPDVADAAHAAATLRGGGYEPRQRVTEGEIWAGVWIYLPQPAAPSADEALKQKLKSAGIDDALDMPGPNDKPVISLGLFSEPRRADARVAKLQALGLNPSTADRKRTGEVYWVDVDLKPNDQPLNPGDLQPEAGRIVRLEVKTCPVTENPPT